MLQVIALVIAAVAIVWGLAMSYAVAFPGPSGEWAAMGIFLAAIFNIPAGIITLVIGLTVKHGSARLRRMCIIASLIALLLPLLPDGIHRYNTRWRHGLFNCAPSQRSSCETTFSSCSNMRIELKRIRGLEPGYLTTLFSTRGVPIVELDPRFFENGLLPRLRMDPLALHKRIPIFCGVNHIYEGATYAIESNNATRIHRCSS